MHQARHVRLFRNGRNQAIRIPREFELPGEEVILHRDQAGRLIIEPLPTVLLSNLLASWTNLEDALPAITDVPPESFDL